MTFAREDYLTWDETFMGLAQLSSMRSKDPSTQVGAVLVNADHRVLSLGYNGTTSGFTDDDMPWGKASDDPADTKYAYVVHAERNCILNYRGSINDFRGATMYVTLFPCYECAKEMAQVGLSRIIYAESRAGKNMEIAMRILDHAGIQVNPYDHSGKTVPLSL
jgi:dCMP deaminase